MQRARIRDAAAVLPLGGVLLFTPPFMRVFDQPISLLGVPLLHVSLFTLWLVGLGLTAWLARRLVVEIDDELSSDGAPGGVGNVPVEGRDLGTAADGDGAGSRADAAR